ncbi:MAG: iron donor protein CyaY [Betaproteobacteria bacterium]|nr:MAG: iron donor protein CyaY [Betaproteobacteria bacterium]
MNETEFEALAGAALSRIEQALEASGVDADFELKAGGVLEIEFADGSKMVINRHGAAREIWVAARTGGFHFRWDGSAWRDTRDGTELFAALSKAVSAQSGRLGGSSSFGGSIGAGGWSTSGGGTASW